MILIAHRGNTKGPEPTKENNPEFIESAIEAGYDVEIDVRLHAGGFYLGHDKPQYEVLPDWLLKHKDNLWCHAKDLKTFSVLLDLKMHTFMHDKDPAALTSKHYLWTNPGERLVPNSIAVMPETKTWYDFIQRFNYVGLCSDYVEDYNE